MEYGNTEGKWLYDIFLDDCFVGNQGDSAFDTKEEAEIDANEHLELALANEYNRNADDFKIEYYQARKEKEKVI